MKKIVAFLQNPWFPPETRKCHIEMYRDNQDFHRRVLLCSMTGKRLEQAFNTRYGNLFRKIHWDNTNWRAATRANGVLAPDYDHMASVIRREDPDLILTFGNQARDAMNHLFVTRNHDLLGPEIEGDPEDYIETMYCHHPNARHKTQADLNKFAADVLEWLYRGVEGPLAW